MTNNKRYLTGFANAMFILIHVFLYFSGVIHSGLTYRQMNNLMATMEIKGLHHYAMRRRQAEIHAQIQDIANKSCSTSVIQLCSYNYISPRFDGGYIYLRFSVCAAKCGVSNSSFLWGLNGF